VYDAINVLMALDVILKDKKVWPGAGGGVEWDRNPGCPADKFEAAAALAIPSVLCLIVA
jgi:hypothetical protein